MAAPKATTSSGLTPRFGLLVEDGLDGLLDFGDARRAADQNHLVDVAGLQFGVGEGLLAGGLGALDQVVHQALELGAGTGWFAGASARFDRR